MRIVLSLLIAGLLAGPAPAVHVPFVGCASDGQVGPQSVPRSRPTPDIAPAAAAKLADYAGPYGAVLAPRGWYCFQSYGSNGASLLVLPRPIRTMPPSPSAGPAIQLSIMEGGTSGRFAVAHIAARLFPAARGFVDQVEAEGVIAEPFARQPYPADKITHRGAYEALITTPANATGSGTDSWLRKGPLPIDSIVIYDPRGDVSLTHLAARLSPAQRPLVAYIIAQIAKTQ